MRKISAQRSRDWQISVLLVVKNFRIFPYFSVLFRIFRIFPYLQKLLRLTAGQPVFGEKHVQIDLLALKKVHASITGPQKDTFCQKNGFVPCSLAQTAGHK